MDQIALFGLILAMACLWVFHFALVRQWKEERKSIESFKKWAAKKAGENVEQRCQHCQEGRECPGYNTGVIYPCEYYKEKSQ